MLIGDHKPGLCYTTVYIIMSFLWTDVVSLIPTVLEYILIYTLSRRQYTYKIMSFLWNDVVSSIPTLRTEGQLMFVWHQSRIAIAIS